MNRSSKSRYLQSAHDDIFDASSSVGEGREEGRNGFTWAGSEAEIALSQLGHHHYVVLRYIHHSAPRCGPNISSQGWMDDMRLETGDDPSRDPPLETHEEIGRGTAVSGFCR